MANVISAQSILEAAREARAFSASEEQVAAARDTLAWLKETRALLEKTRAEGGKLHTVTDFTGKSDAFKKFLFDTLDSGEIRIMLEGGQVRMEETGVPTVWRIMIGKQDMLVTAYIPEVVTTYSSRAELEDIVEPEKQPEGLFAAPAIFSELRHLLADLRSREGAQDSVPPAIELSRQPLSPADKSYINEVLGRGSIEVQMQGFARSTITQTRVRGVWRSKILNKANKELLDEIVVSDLPPEIPSTPEELPGAISKLTDMIEWIELDLSRGAIG